MKFFVLFAFFLAFSCSSPDHQDSEPPPVTEVDLAAISGSRGKKKFQRVSVVKDINERDRKVNPLKDEEFYLARKKKREQRRLKFPISAGRKNTPEVFTICRRFDGCQRFCADWLNQNIDCNQWSVSRVVAEWSSMLDSLNTEQLFVNARWLAQHQDVSVFLREADHDQSSIVGKIISRLSYESCSFSEGLDIYHSVDTTKANLYLVHPEEGRKKITDYKRFNVDINMFKGFAKKCLTGQKLSLSELMLTYQNTLGFQLAHQKMAEGCSHNEECIQLAYCKVDSESVWAYLEEVKYSDDFNIEVQTDKCSYEDFSSLPSTQL